MPGTHQQQQPSHEDPAKWLRSYGKVSKWLLQYDVMRLLAQHGGLCRIRNFLPPAVAEHAYQQVRNVPEHAWNATGAAEDYQQNNIDHFFWSTKQAANIQGLLRVFSLLLPGKLHTFSAARYDTSHHIAAHDDRAYTDVVMEDGQVVECSRTVAVIYYLTKDWRPEWGGHLVDLEGEATIVPEFNSLVAFVVPRYHEVTPVMGSHSRYSVFGWFLEPGRLYDLYGGNDEEEQEAVHAVQHSGRLLQQVAAAAGTTLAGGEGSRAGPLLQLQQQDDRGARHQHADAGADGADGEALSSSSRRSKRRRQAGVGGRPDMLALGSSGTSSGSGSRGMRDLPELLPLGGSSSGSQGAGSRHGEEHEAADAATRDGSRGDIRRGDELVMTLPVSRRGVLRLMHRLQYC